MNEYFDETQTVVSIMSTQLRKWKTLKCTKSIKYNLQSLYCHLVLLFNRYIFHFAVRLYYNRPRGGFIGGSAEVCAIFLDRMKCGTCVIT